MATDPAQCSHVLNVHSLIVAIVKCVHCLVTLPLVMSCHIHYSINELYSQLHGSCILAYVHVMPYGICFKHGLVGIV